MIIPEEEQAMKEAEAERGGSILWANSSTKEDEWVACAVVWKEERWENRRVYLG